ncbi:MAG: hypothetical protein AAF675_11775 [Pseudomonadota bacterium]
MTLFTGFRACVWLALSALVFVAAPARAQNQDLIGERGYNQIGTSRGSLNQNLEDSCSEQLKAEYGAEKVGSFEVKRRGSDHRRLYTTITRADGSTQDVRCVVRKRKVTGIQSPSGSGWEDAATYEAPPEDPTVAAADPDGTPDPGTDGEATPEGGAPGAPGAEGGDGDEGEPPTADASEDETAEADEDEGPAVDETTGFVPATPKRMRVQ